MLKLSRVLILLGILLSPVASADVQVSIGIGLPHVSIGINVPAYPRLVPIPGYPVYYAPSLRANFFFYDGMYWVYQDDYWYASSWYNGPWWIVGPEVVPVFILRVPVRYYRQPPYYFREWRADAPPRWGDHWGRDWEQRRGDWDRWDRRSVPPPAPPPDYQRQYSGGRYPRQVEQQYDLHQKNYRYQPQESAVREHYREQIERRSPGRRDDTAGSRSQPSPREDKDLRKSSPASSPQERQEAPDRKPSQQRESESRDRPVQSAPDQQERSQQDRDSSRGERGSNRQDMQQRQQSPRSEPREQPGQVSPNKPDKWESPDERDFRQQDMQQSPRRQQEPRSQQPQRNKKDDSRSVPGHPWGER